MKTYVAITGSMFGLIVVAHVWRLADEGAQLAHDPVYILLTLAAAGLCLWAVRLLVGGGDPRPR